MRRFDLFPNTLSDSKIKEESFAYASSVDTQNHYCKNQKRWQDFSAAIINEIIDSIKNDGSWGKAENDSLDRPDFEALYGFCAEKRGEIAKELRHGEDWDRTSWFGEFRKETFKSHEFFLNSGETQAWPKQKDAVFKHVADIVDGTPDINDEENIESKSYDLMKNVNDDGSINYSIDIKSPMPQRVNGKNHSRSLSYITYLKDPANSSNNEIKIIYTAVNKYDKHGDFELADNYYKAIMQLNVSSKQGRKEFMLGLARLMHLMAHLLPVKRGNAGICEWIMRAIAFKKSIEIGEFNHDEGISWDFKALVTPDREAYAEWFASKALYITADHTPNENRTFTL